LYLELLTYLTQNQNARVEIGAVKCFAYLICE